MNDKYNFKIYIVRSPFLCAFLMLMGHKLLSISPNKDDAKKNVFCFYNTERLLHDINVNYKKFQDIINPIIKKLKL